MALKAGKKQDFKVPLKNTGKVPVTLEFDIINPFLNKIKEDNENDKNILITKKNN